MPNWDWQPKSWTDPPEIPHTDDCEDDDCDGECVAEHFVEPD